MEKDVVDELAGSDGNNLSVGCTPVSFGTKDSRGLLLELTAAMNATKAL